MSTIVIRGEDLVASVADALQIISFAHPADFVRHLAAAWKREESAPARQAIGQILVNSRMARLGQRPICQDTGIVNVFLRMGMNVRIEGATSLQELIDEGVRRAYCDPANPLRGSMVADPLGDRRNTGDNTPAVIHTELVPGNTLEVTVAAKGGGSENKATFAVLLPGADLVEWVVNTVEHLGAGWCPPGVLGIGVGGTVERSMLLAKQALMEHLDMGELLARGPSSPLEELRVRIYERVNALGIGAQGLGGLTTVLDVKIRSFATHAASMPVALIPNCAATRHVTFALDGSGPATLEPAAETDWPELILEQTAVTRVDLATLTREQVATWQVGQTLLLSGKLLTARDAAHRRLAQLHAKGEPLPVDLAGRVIYYVGPVPAAAGEVVGPAGPTTATRMDPYMDLVLGQGVLATIGKAERGAQAIESIRRHGAASLIAVGGAAYLVSKAIRQSRVLAFADLGMEAVHEFDVVDMPVLVSVDASGRSAHSEGPAIWKRVAPPRSSRGAGG